MIEIEFITSRRGNDLVVINKNARYQVGLIHVNGDYYTVDGDDRKFKHVNNALETLLRIVSTV